MRYVWPLRMPIALCLAMQAVAGAVLAQTKTDPVGCYDLRIGAWDQPVGSQAEPRNMPPTRFELARGATGEGLVSPIHAHRDATASWRELSGDSIYVLWKTTRWGGPAIRVRVHADSLTGVADIVSDFRPRVAPHAPVFARRVACQPAPGARTTLARDAEAMISAVIRNALAPRSAEPPKRVGIEPVLASTGRIGATTLVDVSAIDIQAVASELGLTARHMNDVMTCGASGCTMNGVDVLLSVGVGGMTQETGVVWITELWLDSSLRRSTRKCEHLMRKDGATWKASAPPNCRNG